MQNVEHIANLIQQSKSSYAFTGAGISTESGIPDFRSPGGVWAKYQPVYFQDFMADLEARREYWRQKCEAHTEFASAQPNVGHQVLSKWERAGKLAGIVTQNIDGLHKLAGSRNIAELHGTAREAACMSCAERRPIQPLVDEFMETQEPPACESCGGPLKHATISFGQSLDPAVTGKVQDWMDQADLVIVLGSSLVVHPAAGYPAQAKQRGAALCIINRDPTPLDALADVVIRQGLGETLQAVDALI